MEVQHVWLATVSDGLNSETIGIYDTVDHVKRICEKIAKETLPWEHTTGPTGEFWEATIQGETWAVERHDVLKEA